jgi:hypothetical protein
MVLVPSYCHISDILFLPYLFVGGAIQNLGRLEGIPQFLQFHSLKIGLAYGYISDTTRWEEAYPIFVLWKYTKALSP